MKHTDSESQNMQQVCSEYPKDLVLMLIPGKWACLLLTLTIKMRYLLSKFFRTVIEQCQELGHGQFPQVGEKFNYDTKDMP